MLDDVEANDNNGDVDVHEETFTEERFTETHVTSWGDRLGSSCCVAIFGVLLFLGSFPLLYWNEGRAVMRYDSLHEAQGVTYPLSSVESINPVAEGRLVHLTSILTSTHQNLTDPIFGLRTNNWKLQRDTEMYQWKESKKTSTVKKLGGKEVKETTYSYQKVWSDHLIDSNSFKKQSGHVNPSYMRFDDLTLSQDNFYVGAFTLPDRLISKIGSLRQFTPITSGLLDPSDITDTALQSQSKLLSNGNGYYISAKNISTSSEYSPQIGDVRVTFGTVLPGATVSILAQQVGNTFQPYQTGAGGTIEEVRSGNMTSDEMYAAAVSENRWLTILLRFAGFIAMAAGLRLMLLPLQVFADVVPILGSMVGCGITFISALLAAVLSTITISICWMIHHPKIGAVILVGVLVAVAVIAFLVKRCISNKKKKDNSNNNGSASYTDGNKLQDNADDSMGQSPPPTAPHFASGAADPPIIVVPAENVEAIYDDPTTTK